MSNKVKESATFEFKDFFPFRSLYCTAVTEGCLASVFLKKRHTSWLMLQA